ncbi:MAG: metallophosphoesterase family protein [Candidatus Thorarchaeota archaeon]
MTVYFTSDWHLFHANIIKYAKRPFKDAAQMNKTILDNFYDAVKHRDTVYFLGDFAFGTKSRISQITEVLSGITSHCKFHMILGNHDNSIRDLFEQHCASVTPLRTIEFQGLKISLCHYPMHSFSGSHYNNWQLYGHHHRDTNTEIPGKRYNVGVDIHDYRPVSFEYLRGIMQERDNNWDFIPPERRRRKQDEGKVRRDLSKAKELLASLRKKMDDDFLENAPAKVVAEMKTSLAEQERTVKELEERVSRLS